MSPIKDFQVKYDPLNQENTFAAGDTITGVVKFRLTEEINIKCLYVKAEGDANVHWTQSNGHLGHHGHLSPDAYHFHHGYSSYSDHKRFYKAKEVLIPETKEGTVLAKGDHQYEFELKIPEGNIPPSFMGYHGKIVHVLQAKMIPSRHTSSSDRKDLNFVTRTFLPTMQQSAQVGTTNKKVGIVSKGQVKLSATVNKKVCAPGETLHVTASIKNKSLKKMRIKFKIDQTTLYRAQSHAKVGTGTICKLVGQTIKPGFKGDVSCPVTIPANAPLSIHNCEIITVVFYLKVYLDISYATDPEVLLPLIIATPGAMMVRHDQDGFPGATGAVFGPDSSNFPLLFPGAYLSSVPPNAYLHPSPGPMPYPNTPGLYNPALYNSQMLAPPSNSLRLLVKASNQIAKHMPGPHYMYGF